MRKWGWGGCACIQQHGHDRCVPLVARGAQRGQAFLVWHIQKGYILYKIAYRICVSRRGSLEQCSFAFFGDGVNCCTSTSQGRHRVCVSSRSCK